MYAMIIAVALGQLQVTQQIEPGTWMYKDKHLVIRMDMQPFGRRSGLKTISLSHTETARGLTGRILFIKSTLVGFYSVEKRGEETLIYCRFQRVKHQTDQNKEESELRKVDYSVVLHAKPTKSGEFEIYFTSDEVKKLSGWVVKKKYVFQKVKKRPVSK